MTDFVVPADNHKGCAGPGPSPVVIPDNTMGWSPAPGLLPAGAGSAGMTNQLVTCHALMQFSIVMATVTMKH